jgi:ADP-ribose pyrophosphatase YjhB (NUDIX family)
MSTVSSISRQPIPAVIAVVLRGESILLVSRRNPPDVGMWGYPGGKIEFGESIEDAATRELLEETGVRARPDRLLTAVDAYDRDERGELRRHFILLAVLCTWEHGEPVAGDDAADAGWFAIDSLDDGSLPLSLDVQRVARLARDALRRSV